MQTWADCDNRWKQHCHSTAAVRHPAGGLNLSFQKLRYSLNSSWKQWWSVGPELAGLHDASSKPVGHFPTAQSWKLVKRRLSDGASWVEEDMNSHDVEWIHAFGDIYSCHSGAIVRNFFKCYFQGLIAARVGACRQEGTWGLIYQTWIGFSIWTWIWTYKNRTKRQVCD